MVENGVGDEAEAAAEVETRRRRLVEGREATDRCRARVMGHLRGLEMEGRLLEAEGRAEDRAAVAAWQAAEREARQVAEGWRRAAGRAERDLGLAQDRLKIAEQTAKEVNARVDAVDGAVVVGRRWQDRAREADGRVAELVAELEWWKARAVDMARGIGLGDAVDAVDGVAAVVAAREVEEKVKAEDAAVDPGELDLEEVLAAAAEAEVADAEVAAAAEAEVADAVVAGREAVVPEVEEF